jgi:hypothetical protein
MRIGDRLKNAYSNFSTTTQHCLPRTLGRWTRRQSRLVSLSKCLTNTIFSETSSVDGCYQRRSESMGEGPHLRLPEPFAQCDRKVTCARSFRGRLKKLAPHDSDQSLTCRVNTVQKVDVAQRVDELLFLYTNIRPRHQRNKTTMGRIVPSNLLIDYNGSLLGDCSKLLRFPNMVSTLSEGLQSDRLRYARFDSEYMTQIDL